eukprot:4379773-Alexandrium_andersonii.AAC.1
MGELQTLHAILHSGLESDARQARASGEAGVPEEGTAPRHVSGDGGLGSRSGEVARRLRPRPEQ